MFVGLPPPKQSLSGQWRAAGICLIVFGGLAFSPLSRTGRVTVWSLTLIAGSAAAIALGIFLLRGVRWAWWPSMAMLAAALVGIVVFVANVVNEPSGSDVEDMRPITVMGSLMWAVGVIVLLVLLASTREPWRAVPAGWRADPRDNGGLRYWDGADWTEHTAPLRPVTSAPAGWFVDPESGAHWRYWDGTKWTGNTAARHTPPPEPRSD